MPETPPFPPRRSTLPAAAALAGCLEFPSGGSPSDALGADGSPTDLRVADSQARDARVQPRPDAVAPDVRVADSQGPDAALTDTVTPDVRLPDASPPDAAFPDAALPDVAVPDAALPDAIPSDAAHPDAAGPDAAPPDAAHPDAAGPDAAPPDAAPPDAALPDASRPDGPPPPPPPCVGEAVPEGFVCIPAGQFTLGSDRPDELAHQVRITQPYFMQATEATRDLWARTMYTHPSVAACADAPDLCPVDSVSYFEAAAYANEHSLRAGLPPCYTLTGCTGVPGAACEVLPCPEPFLCDQVVSVGPTCAGFRLPTEAEWEHAARAGTETDFWSGEFDRELTDDHLTENEWYAANSGTLAHASGTLTPNPWGLYDMLGNVAEWTGDGFEPYFAPMPEEPIEDPVSAPFAPTRVVRGGNFESPAEGCRAAGRRSVAPDAAAVATGLRLVRLAGACPGETCEETRCDGLDEDGNGVTDDVAAAFVSGLAVSERDPPDNNPFGVAWNHDAREIAYVYRGGVGTKARFGRVSTTGLPRAAEVILPGAMGALSADVAWNEELGVYGVVWAVDGVAGPQFATVRPGEAPVWGPDIGGIGAANVGIVATPGGFGLAWGNANQNPVEVAFLECPGPCRVAHQSSFAGAIHAAGPMQMRRDALDPTTYVIRRDRTGFGNPTTVEVVTWDGADFGVVGSLQLVGDGDIEMANTSLAPLPGGGFAVVGTADSVQLQFATFDTSARFIQEPTPIYDIGDSVYSPALLAMGGDEFLIAYSEDEDGAGPANRINLRVRRADSTGRLFGSTYSPPVGDDHQRNARMVWADGSMAVLWATRAIHMSVGSLAGCPGTP